jgi:hypothetical protein
MAAGVHQRIVAVWHWGRGKLARQGAWGGRQLQAAAPACPTSPPAGRWIPWTAQGYCWAGWQAGAPRGAAAQAHAVPISKLELVPRCLPPARCLAAWSYRRVYHDGSPMHAIFIVACLENWIQGGPGRLQQQAIGAGDEEGRRGLSRSAKSSEGWAQDAPSHDFCGTAPFLFAATAFQSSWFALLGIARAPRWVAEQKQEAGEPPNAHLTLTLLWVACPGAHDCLCPAHSAALPPAAQPGRGPRRPAPQCSAGGSAARRRACSTCAATAALAPPAASLTSPRSRSMPPSPSTIARRCSRRCAALAGQARRGAAASPQRAPPLCQFPGC